MSDLEGRLQMELVRRAGVRRSPTMPAGTLGRVHRRQALVASLAMAIVVGSVATGIGLFQAAPSNVESGSGSLRPPASALELVPEGWPSVDVLRPSGAYSPSPADVGPVGSVRVLATGTADGYGFSFLAWTGSGDRHDAAPDGPCILFAGPTPGSINGAAGGPISATCGHFWDPPIPDGTDLIVTSQQNADAEGIGATFGFVSPRVSKLVVRVEGDTDHSIPILTGPAGWDGVRAFLVFAPADRPGVLAAFSSDGTLLARGETCRFRPGAGGACTVEATQVAPIPSR